MEYSKFLYEFNNHVWMGYLAALLTAYLLKLGSRSYFIGGLVIVIMNFVMMVIEPTLVDLAKEHAGFVKQAWYPTWAACNVVGALLIYKIHVHENVKIDFVSMSCMFSMALMCVVQSLRYIDMIVLEMNFMGSAFRVIVNTINVGYFAFLLLPLVSAVKARMSGASI